MNHDVWLIPFAFFVAFVLPVYIFSKPRSRAAYLAFIALLLMCSMALIYLALTNSG